MVVTTFAVTRCLCGTREHAEVRARRLRVVHVVRDVDGDELAAELGAGVGPREREHATVGHRARVEELHSRAVGAGRVAVGAVEQLESRAVGINRVEVDRVVAAGVVPAAEHHAPVGQHRGVEVVALVEGELADVAAVRVHHVQHERRLDAALVQRRELRLALVEQHGARLALARGGEHDPPVGQVVRREVVAVLGDDVGGDHAAQRVAGRPRTPRRSRSAGPPARRLRSTAHASRTRACGRPTTAPRRARRRARR